MASLSLTFPNSKMGIVVMSKRQSHEKSIACRKHSIVFRISFSSPRPDLFFWCQLWPRLNSEEALLFGFSFEGRTLLFSHLGPSVVLQICYICYSSMSLLMLTPLHVLPSPSLLAGQTSTHPSSVSLSRLVFLDTPRKTQDSSTLSLLLVHGDRCPHPSLLWQT